MLNNKICITGLGYVGLPLAEYERIQEEITKYESKHK